MKVFIGIDIGTTSTKALAFTPFGSVVAQHAAGYPISHPHPEFSEQNPLTIRDAVLECLNTVLAICNQQYVIEGVAFSTAMHSLIPTDAAGIPLGNMIIWADNRAATLAEALKNTETGRQLFSLTGTPIHAMSPLAKLQWIRSEQPDIWNRTACFHDIKSYIWSYITGESCTDLSIGSAGGLMNLKGKYWEPAALQWIGLDESRLPVLVAPRHTTGFRPAQCPALHLPAGTPLVIGASDGCLANLGMGALDPGVLAVTIGTSGAIRMGIPEAATDPAMRIFCYYLDEGQYITGGGTNSGAIVLQWLKEQVFQDNQSTNAFLNLAAGAPPGAEGLLFHPYLLGERAPFWDARLTGRFDGLGLQHTKAHFIRAAMEGVILHLHLLKTILAEQAPVRNVIAGGGFAQNRLWVQMLADIFQAPVEVPEMVESSALGAVVLGRTALGLPAMPRPAIADIYVPDAGLAGVYAELAGRF
jgi:gluconokinase